MQPELAVESRPSPRSAPLARINGNEPDASEQQVVILPPEKSARRAALRISLKLLAAAALILMLILFTSTEVDFVYTGF